LFSGVPEPTGDGMSSVGKAKPFDIPKREVWEAFKKVKANHGAAGVDGQTVADFEADLSNNLYKLWNRMSSGSYFPPPVRRVDIPKGDSATETRPLGIPTVADRIAQEVVKRYLEPLLEAIFHRDSYGYRPGRSAIDAVRTARQRCWRYDWTLDIDVKGYLDASSHYTSRFFERSEEVRSDCRYLNSYAFCPSAIDVNSLELATLYTLQDRLPRDTE
jgi:retron-type reverse transcriptase